MAVTPANENSLEAWEKELATGIEVLELLEAAEKLCRTLSNGRNAADTVKIAIDDATMCVSKAALKVGRLRRDLEN